MTRAIKKRFRVYAELEATSPIHAGGAGNNALVDLPLAVNGQGRYYIPGTSLAGALRNWMRENLGQQLADNLWGPVLRPGDDNKSWASFILVEDSLLPEKAIAEIRDGVGIDRYRGAAAEKIKFDRAIIPRGTVFPLELTVEIPTKRQSKKSQAKTVEEIPTEGEPEESQAKTEGEIEESQAKAALDALIAALSSEEIRIGAAKSRGLGRVKIKGTAKLLEENLNTPKSLLEVLKRAVLPSDDRQQWDDYCLPEERKYLPKLIFEIAWQPKGPVMVKAEAEGLAVNILPLTSGIDGSLALVLPGSSLKGALRFQAERILRTLGVQEEPAAANQRNSSGTSSTSEPEGSPTRTLPDTEAKQNFFSRLELPLVTTLFGTAKTASSNGNGSQEPLPGRDVAPAPPVRVSSSDNSSPELLPGLSALAVEDCYCDTRMTAEKWQAIAQSTNSPELREALTEAGMSKTQQAYHVAVDRWTGGAADSMLYSALEPFGVKWQPLCLTLNFNRIPENERLCAIALLLLTLRDLSEGRIPLGYGVNRGMGAIAVCKISIQGQGLTNIEPAILRQLEKGISYTGTNIADLGKDLLNQGEDLLNQGEDLLNELNLAWGAWIDDKTKEKTA